MTTYEKHKKAHETVLTAIERSISHTETVRLPYDVECCLALQAECDDSAESSEFEFWGTRHGAEWRVHVLKH